MLIVVALVGVTTAVAAAAAANERRVIRQVFGSRATTAECIADHESTFRSWVSHYNTNGTVDRGLFQINSTWVGKVVSWYGSRPHVWIRVRADRLYRARYNTLVAWAISRGGRAWGPWTTRWYCA